MFRNIIILLLTFFTTLHLIPEKNTVEKSDIRQENVVAFSWETTYGHRRDKTRIESKHQVTILGGLNEFVVKFFGPTGTLYEGGVWKVRVDLPDKYPFKSPSIGFLNKIYHPNIDEASGTVCLDVINQTWTALYDLSNIFEAFLPQLLAYPNPVDPLNGDAAALYLHKPEQYKDRIRDYIRKYATEEALKEQEVMSSSSDESSISDYSEDEAQDMEL